MDNPDNLMVKKAALEEESRQMKSKIATLPGLKRKEKELRGLVEIYEKALPQEQKLTNLYKMIGSHSHQSKLRVIEIKYDKPKGSAKIDPKTGEPLNPYLSYAVTIKMEGDYQSILNFIHQVESMDRFVRIDRIKLSNEYDPNDDNNSEYMSGTIKFVSFFAPSPKEKKPNPGG